MDNRSLKPRQRKQVDIGGFIDEAHPDRPHISSQQRLAIYQFLSSSKNTHTPTCIWPVVRPQLVKRLPNSHNYLILLSGINAFKSDKVRPAILKRLLNQDVVHKFTLEEVQARSRTLYCSNVPAVSFTLIIEGHVEVEVGRDGMKFEAGPFHHFGVQALESDGDYVPDFTVRPTSDCILLVITCGQYFDACKATLFQQTKDHENSNQLNSHNHLSPIKTPISTPSSPPTKSATKLKSVSTKKHHQSKEGKKLETQLLLSDSLSDSLSDEEEEKDEGDEVFTTTNCLPDTTVMATGEAITVEVEMHSVVKESLQQRTSGRGQLPLEEEPPTFSSSQC